MTSCPDLAAAVEQDLADVAPNRMRPAEPDRIEPLDLDAPGASDALDPEEFARDFRKSPLRDGQSWLPGGARVPENRLPIFVGKKGLRREIVDSGGPQPV